jgi:hypothetical protein
VGDSGLSGVGDTGVVGTQAPNTTAKPKRAIDAIKERFIFNLLKDPRSDRLFNADGQM